MTAALVPLKQNNLVFRGLFDGFILKKTSSNFKLLDNLNQHAVFKYADILTSPTFQLNSTFISTHLNAK